jgi:TetR/AcrR family fatty acid metabolism transcriptional regulator
LEQVRGAVSSVLKRRVVKPSEQRRTEILQAALNLFSEKGFGETTVEDVAQAAGVAKGTIYLYFRSKEHLLLALKKQFMSGLVDALTDLIAEAVERLSAGEPLDYRDIIDDIFQAIIDYHCRQRDAVEVVVRQNPGPDLVPEVLELEKDFLALLTSAFRAGAEYGIIHTEDPEMCARLVNAAIRDNIASCLCYEDPPDLDRLVMAMRQMLYKALAPGGEMPPRRPRLVKARDA